MKEKAILKQLARLFDKPKIISNRIEIISLVHQLKQVTGEKLSYGHFCSKGNFETHISRNTFNRYSSLGEVANILNGKAYVKNMSELESFAEQHKDVSLEELEAAVKKCVKLHQKPFLSVISNQLAGMVCNSHITALIEYAEKNIAGSSKCIVLNKDAINGFVVNLNTELCQQIFTDHDKKEPKYINTFVALFMFLVETSAVFSCEKTHQICVANSYECFKNFDGSDYESNPNVAHVYKTVDLIVNTWKQVGALISKTANAPLSIAQMSKLDIVSNHFNICNLMRLNEEMSLLRGRFQ